MQGVGHRRRECSDIKAWLAKKGNNEIISFIDESFITYYLSNIWWIDFGAIVHVTSSSLGFLGVRTTRGERNLKVADGREAKVEDVGTVPLVLPGGFTLVLNNVLFVLSLKRNLISFALLEDEG
jgi:hypothetical protein